jgi:primosomal protein N' (replication factor Y)
MGFGTEKVEEELAIFFPGAKIARMDLDTTRSKFAYQHLISDFEERNIDILVGTQMVTKGLDFDHVSVVGILNADSMLNYPDFRAFERSYQLMAQVAGRAGRKSKRGKVIIQTHNPHHAVIGHVLHHDFEKMYNEQLAERRSFSYPPFYRLIEITLLHKDLDQLNHSADFLADKLKKQLGQRVIGPGFPLVPRIRNLYHKNILVKIEKESSVSKVKEILGAAFSMLRNHPEHKTVRIQPDVDPM